MAWRSSGSSNADLIDKMAKNGLINSSKVAEAMRKVDRKNYVPDPTWAYEDSPQRIGFGATISAPHMHAHACENLLPFLPSAERDREGTASRSILDVGSGSGYLCAVFHHLAPHSTVVGIDHIQGLVDQSISNLKADGVSARKGGRVIVLCGDGRKGEPEYAPYSIIHVGAAAPQIPQPLIEQLAKPGRMFIPVGEGSQDIWQIDKDAQGAVTKKKLFGVMYVPLTDADKQWRGV
ncbi:protein-L-isoaspartate O-methyltransferase [Kwoniella heveanensis CBS 569]|uniref:protein-L-isoaspartate(D-aspartate) O-methyltransferase n=1 Tax=Kwoniella heveanensis BCC8398 TaxID=1296120 RepID=A0A1B9GZX4_9TREE|nr:protein-L-isoaspartate O-methyltransferase [Kwoniella heveanensis BCC8398]OCF45452.1 protein-L-isoaspartate O-methyltransferase [Kwoniella heveanensis CBS 569]